LCSGWCSPAAKRASRRQRNAPVAWLENGGEAAVIEPRLWRAYFLVISPASSGSESGASFIVSVHWQNEILIKPLGSGRRALSPAKKSKHARRAVLYLIILAKIWRLLVPLLMFCPGNCSNSARTHFSLFPTSPSAFLALFLFDESLTHF